MVQRLMRIHVTEEARHIQFARDGARKRVEPHAPAQQVVHGQHQRGRRLLLPLPVQLTRSPTPATGLDAARARAAARASPHPARGSGGRLRAAGGVFDRGGPDGPDRAPQLEALQVSVTPALVIGRGSRRAARRSRAAGRRHHRLHDPGQVRPRSRRRGVRRRHRHLAAANRRRGDLRGRCRHRGPPTDVRSVDTRAVWAQRLSRNLVSRGAMGPRFRSGRQTHRGDRRRRHRRPLHAGQLMQSAASVTVFALRTAPGRPGDADADHRAPNAGCAAAPDGRCRTAGGPRWWGRRSTA